MSRPSPPYSVGKRSRPTTVAARRCNSRTCCQEFFVTAVGVRRISRVGHARTSVGEPRRARSANLPPISRARRGLPGHDSLRESYGDNESYIGSRGNDITSKRRSLRCQSSNWTAMGLAQAPRPDLQIPLIGGNLSGSNQRRRITGQKSTMSDTKSGAASESVGARRGRSCGCTSDGRRRFGTSRRRCPSGCRCRTGARS